MLHIQYWYTLFPSYISLSKNYFPFNFGPCLHMLAVNKLCLQTFVSLYSSSGHFVHFIHEFNYPQAHFYYFILKLTLPFFAMKYFNHDERVILSIWLHCHEDGKLKYGLTIY